MAGGPGKGPTRGVVFSVRGALAVSGGPAWALAGKRDQLAAAVGAAPVGPSVGAAAVVLILGANGVALTAAAGVLLTVTGTVGALCFASWAVLDRMPDLYRTASRRPA